MAMITRRALWADAVHAVSSVWVATNKKNKIRVGVHTARRFRSHLAPRRTKYRKSQKGRVPLPTGGSVAGTTLTIGEFGMRIRVGTRLTAEQLSAAQIAIKRSIKPCKGAKVYLRVFPDVPVTRKGNEVRMGKGKGAFDHWACRVSPGKVIMEIRSNGDLRPEMAKEAIRLAGHKMPVPVEFLEKSKLEQLARKAAEQQKQQLAAALESAESVPAAAKASTA
ncbi:ribosomal protein L16p/L10e-domain-containing protein [Thamnocephalis sphaerospora]|uniref:Ribosomal protein L16p/L10e-domain-containing protein n=1 Tax=Thamnocephalis sphaerospora TaxID=78915 RepID=A0A4P9XNC6_9FUNG|nr:ribosomal protein L16p/L10e-domain-containing protein [Thamnocephalis sphaerospora]|eukprot:RKP07453.1 ribosomal protein L16p/L10e-domain-containing protein [Thamnocephalis sphaerospora]